MSDFTDLEYSVDSGEPFELYEFTRGTWSLYLTTRKTEFYVHDLQIFEPSSIIRGGITHGEDMAQGALELKLPRGSELVEDFFAYPPEITTSVTVKKLHRGLTYEDAVVIWKGRIAAVDTQNDEVTITCESIYASMRRVGLRLRCELICQHSLYSEQCGADQPAVRFDDTISGVTNPTTLVMSATSGYADGWFTGGVLEWINDSRFITYHSGNTLILSRPLSGLAAGILVALYPGCSLTVSDCKTKFDNLVNYLGFPWMPTRNPFAGPLV